MNLSQREKILAAGVGLVVLLFVGRYFSTTILKGFDAKSEKRGSLEKTQEEQNLKMIEGTIAKVKLNRVAAQSLPSNEEKARAEYMRWLIDLADEAGLQDLGLWQKLPNLAFTTHFDFSSPGWVRSKMPRGCSTCSMPKTTCTGSCVLTSAPSPTAIHRTV